MLRVGLLSVIFLLLLGATALGRQSAPLNPFVLPWDDASPGITNVSALLDKPAGKAGFVVAKDGHLYTGDKRFRFLGVNICFGAAFPTHADAEKIAARMAKFGINCVRFHHMDYHKAPDGILSEDAKTLDPGQMDKLDYFIAQLKANGVYSDLNLHVSRTYPGMETWNGMPSYFKGVDNFYAPMIELQREYARDLLTHVNPYTKTRYADEPAVAIIEINNENGLISQWWNGDLDDMPDVYAKPLEAQWNAYLKPRYPSADALAQAWGARKEPVGREMIANGSFSQGDKNWNLQLIEGAEAKWEFVREGPKGEDCLRVTVDRQGILGWHVQFYTPAISLEESKIYTLTFYAKADSPRRIELDAMETREPWGHFWDTSPKLSDKWQRYSYSFSPSQSCDHARITFSSLSQSGATFRFTGISLVPGGALDSPGNESGSVKMIGRSDYGGYPKAVQRDWISFLWQTEEKYWNGMKRYLKDDLKAKSLVLGTQSNNSPFAIQAQMDVTDAHSYWKHPRSQPGADDWAVDNTPMAGSPNGGMLTGLGLLRVAGKPFVVTEYNHPAPNTYSSEAFILLGAYAALQDWDGVFAFSYSHRRDDWDLRRIPNFFDIDQHPTKMVTLPAAAALFLRGDMSAASKHLLAKWDRESVLEAIRESGAQVNATRFGITNEQALKSQVAISLDGSKQTAPAASPARTQFVWDFERKAVTINTNKSKAYIGPSRAGIALGNVTLSLAENQQDWAAITLTAMTGKDFASKGSILITATGYTENTSMIWKNPEKSSVGKNWGTAPSLVEGIPATITLPIRSSRVRAWSLDEKGQRKEIVPVSRSEKASIEIGPEYGTLWYEVEVR